MPTIRELRKSNFLTQEEMAAKAGIARRTLSRVETGAEYPSGPTIRKIAKAVKVRPQDIEFINISVKHTHKDELTLTAREYIKALNEINQKLFKGIKRTISEKEVENVKQLHTKWQKMIMERVKKR
jgi:transcriptional regulator with XRE-family HTH domain